MGSISTNDIPLASFVHVHNVSSSNCGSVAGRGNRVEGVTLHGRWRARIDAMLPPGWRTDRDRLRGARQERAWISYVTINKSWTALTPGAIHAASLARSRAYHDPTAPCSVTKPSTTLTRMK